MATQKKEVGDSAGVPTMCTVCVVSNIPKTFRSSHLRKYFYQFVEGGHFLCFHYRHRPETKLSKDQHRDLSSNSGETFCCAIKVKSDKVRFLVEQFHLRNWDPDVISLGKVVIVATELATTLSELPELNPPKMMPQGNVGTPTKTFFNLVNRCLLPPSIIKKLELSFPRHIKRKQYSAVPPYYINAKFPKSHSTLSSKTAAQTNSSAQTKSSKEAFFTKSEIEDKNNSDDGEDWERHEALHDDVTAHGRTKERLFEEDMEIVWDKGSSGLVFYTDGNFWADMEGKDTDGLWADDWDVDMGIYEGQTGDKDANDYVSTMKSIDFKAGVEEEDTIGHFEKHTKGFGSKIMRQQGWWSGKGLGKSKIGPPVPVSADAVQCQNPRNKSGLGFRGDPSNFQPVKKLIMSAEDDDEYVRIGSKYDNGQPSRSSFNVQEPLPIKRRN